MEDLKTIIQQIAKNGNEIQTYAAKVVAINKEEKSNHNPEEAYTINVVRSDGAEIRNVRLKASIQDKEQGIVCVPKLNSWVFISIIETTETRAFVSQFSEIDKIFLRIKNEENKFFEASTDVNQTKLVFKQEKEEGEGSTKKKLYKEILSLDVNSNEKFLKLKFWDEEKEKVKQETILAHDKIQTSFIDVSSDDEKILQQTVFDETKVEVKFDKGYELKVTKENANIKSEQKDLEFDMEETFLITAGGENLKSQLDSFIDEVSKIVVVQGTSPNVGSLNGIKEKIGKILR